MKQRVSRRPAGHSRTDVKSRESSVAATPLGDVAVVATVTAVALLVLAPVLNNGFVNWDDPFTLTNNSHLAFPGVFAWAFTTFEMGHFQPLAWLAWASTKAIFGPSPRAFHALSLLCHVANALLVYFTAMVLAASASVDRRTARTAAILAALTFSIHPMQVEAVAWASAFPYTLSLALLLISLLAYLRYTRQSEPIWLIVSCGTFALSLASRANGLAFPLVLLVLDAYPLERLKPGASRRSWKWLLLEKTPFGLFALAAAVVESRARDLPNLADIGLADRLAITAIAPFKYLFHALVPYRLIPVDALPLTPHTNAWVLFAAAGALVLVSALAWMNRARLPFAATGWFAYLLLLAPVAGLTPSGQQVTADRYMYLPGVVVALAVGAAIAAAGSALTRRTWVALAAVAVAWLAIIGSVARHQVTWWRDSITLWTRTLDLDSTNDLASYNLAVALADAGRVDEAIARYEQTLRLVPDQRLARENRDRLVVQRDEIEGDHSLQSGSLQDAVDSYSRALAIDPHLTRARSGRGIALARSGRVREAIEDLQDAFDQTADPGVGDALAFALADSGRMREAVNVLKRALARHGDNAELAGNLARLLATSPDLTVRDPALALRLSLQIRDQTRGSDPRVLDTLAAAYAATHQPDLARQTIADAVRLARQQGKSSLADEIEFHARAYGR